MGILRLGIVWLLIAALAAFVIFVECMANVGGDADPILEPVVTPVATEAS